MGGAPSSARVLIIGGGIGGMSAAYHLAKLGVEDVLVLERAKLGSGTTWHSTGNMETYRADPLIFEMVSYAAHAYPKIANDSRRDIGWRVVGRVMYTDREERWEHMRTLPELGRACGIDIELLSPTGLRTRLPIIAAEELIGGIWVPSDARVNPTDAVSALGQLARACGVTIREHCPVLGITLRDDSVHGVITSAGEISCDIIVLAAGLWSGDLAKSCGLRLPLHALEHQYLITQPCGIERNLPLFLSFDDQLYGREEVGGLIVGSLDDHAIPISTAQLPQDFASCLLNERWEQFEPYMATAIRRFPALQTTPVKMLLNGPESFTPDGQMLLGPVPGVTGLYAACGFNSNGMALAPAAGRYIAEWIVEGAPSADVAALDVRRFSKVQSTEAYLRERVTEIPGYHCRMRSPDDDYQTARDIRRSPLHDQLTAEGAKFTSVNGWERALWFDRGALDPSWLSAVAQEAAAAAEGALLIDRSADVRYLLVGVGVREWLKVHAPPLLRVCESHAMLTPMPGAHGEVEALARMLERQTDHCWLTASPEQETRLGEWLRVNLPNHIRTVDQTGTYACLELRGPRRAALLQNASGSDAAESLQGDPPVGWLANAQIDAFEDPLQDSTVITVASEFAADVWRRLCAAGKKCDLELGGHMAEEAVRIARGIPAFGREIGPATLISEMQSAAIRLAPAGTRADVPHTHRACIVAAFTSPMPLLGFGAHDIILDEGRPVGELTSRVRLPGWEATLALGRLDATRWRGQSLQTVVGGATWPLAPRDSAWQAAIGRAAE